ncbi:MAG: hypothetical protein AB7F43_08560 [Bacteriovoracia bacterium]
MRAVFLLLCCLLVGCQGDDRLKEKANIESKAAAENTVNAENESRNKRAAEMEEDLGKRYRFFQAVSGTFEGVLEVLEHKKFKVSFAISLNRPIYKSSRTRTPEEIANDLANLSLNVTATVSDKEGTLTGACTFTEIRPDIATGKIELVSKECNKSYTIVISDQHLTQNDCFTDPDYERATKIASNVIDGNFGRVDEMHGDVKPKLVDGKFRFAVSRVQ